MRSTTEIGSEHAPRRFALPHEVIEDPSLSLAEKRAILAEWASDRSAVESRPTLRWLSGTAFPVTFSLIVDARRELDRLTPPFTECNRPELGRLVVADFAGRRVSGWHHRSLGQPRQNMEA